MANNETFEINSRVCFGGDVTDAGTVIGFVTDSATTPGSRNGGFNTGSGNFTTGTRVRYMVRWDADGSEDLYFATELTGI